jgi:hypothetical protein
MAKSGAFMLVGGIVDPGAGQPGAVVAFVAVSGGRAGSRLFRVEGRASAPVVRELQATTTVDIGRFNHEMQSELQPAVLAVEEAGGKAAIAKPNPAWVCKQVRDHLQATEGLSID